MKNLSSVALPFLFWLLSTPLWAEPIVEVTATLVPVQQILIDEHSQIELRQEVSIAKSRGAEDLLKLSAVVASGKWATIQRGREFWHPKEYSDAIVHKAAGDEGTYSVKQGALVPGASTVIIPNSPTEMNLTDLGALLRVRPTVKDNGQIYLEGNFTDTVFEGLSEETIPISVQTESVD